MRIFYFSTALSDDIYDSIVKKSNTFKPTFSGVGFDRNVATGLSDYANVQGISYYPIPSYPKYHGIAEKKCYFKSKSFDCFVPGIINLPVIKEFSYYIASIHHVKELLHTTEDDNVIVISGLYRCLLRPAKKLKKRYGFKICAIVPDLPELMITYRKDYTGIRRLLNILDVKESQKYRNSIDAFVLLSKYMNEPVNKHNKPVLVVDGLTDISAFPKIDKSKDRIILYAGKVSSTFGVDKLVAAYMKADLASDIKLYICGDGDYAPELIKISSANESIVYLGSVPHEKVLELEVMSTLLVDPRPSNTELVKMSFPSKIIEYMASGTPVLTTNLPCFDEEYGKFQFRITDESIDGISQSLQDVLKLSKETLNAIGENAKEFVINNKTLQNQCDRINSFLIGLDGDY